MLHHNEKKRDKMMRFMWVAIKLKIKELMCNKAYMAVLLLLPILIFALGNYGMRHMKEVSLKAGIYLEETTPLSLKMQELLVQDTSIEYKVYDSAEALEKAVSVAEIECGFIIKKIIEDVAKGEKEEAAIEMLVSPSSIACGPIQETINAAFFRLTAGDIALATLEDKEYMNGAQGLKEKIDEKIEGYYIDGDLMQAKLVISGSNGEQAKLDAHQNAGILQLCKGFIGVFLFVASLLLGVKVSEERKGQLYKRFITIRKSQGHIEYAIIVASSLCQMVIGGLALGILYSIVKIPFSIEVVKEFVILGIYIMAMNSVVLLLSLCIREEQIWIGIIPVLSIACVIFCPIVIDLSNMHSFLRYGSYIFPGYYYLMGKVYVLLGMLLFSLLGYNILKKVQQ